MRLSSLSVFLLPASHALPSSPTSGKGVEVNIPELFSEITTAKIWRVALDLLDEASILSSLLKYANTSQLPDRYPEKVPNTGPNTGEYALEDVTFWTSGFFPGSLYNLLDRSVRFPSHFPANNLNLSKTQDQPFELARQWMEPLHQQALRTDTHDLGFMIMPALQKDWELTGNQTSLDTIVTAAHSLATRFDRRVNAIRSWDSLQTEILNITDMETNFLIIVDSMCNMDLLFYAGQHTSNETLTDIATKHARTVLQDIVRPDYSTYHCCNINPQTAEIIWQKTVQGYQDWSTWTRGQAWGILGFTQTYGWTKDPVFLDAAKGIADYFIDRLASSEQNHPFVPLWDFDAPIVNGELPPRDTSAATAAATGLLKLHQILKGNSPYLNAAAEIISQTVDLSYSHDPASLDMSPNETVIVSPPYAKWDSILMNATENNNEFAFSRSKNTGIVYADYYFLQYGTALLEMGFV